MGISQQSLRQPFIQYPQKTAFSFPNNNETVLQSNKNQTLEISADLNNPTQADNQDNIILLLDNSSDFIQNQKFQIQKKCILQVLLIFIFWSFIQFSILYTVFNQEIFYRIDLISPYLFHLSVLFMYGIAKFGTIQFSRKYPYNSLILLLQLILTTLTYMTFCRSFSHERLHIQNETQYTTADLITLFALQQFLFNILISLTLILYLVLEKQNIRPIIALGSCFISSLIPLIFNYWLFINSILSILYGSTLIFVIMQIFKGRFQMRNSSVQKLYPNIQTIITATNVLFFGLISPIDFN